MTIGDGGSKGRLGWRQTKQYGVLKFVKRLVCDGHQKHKYFAWIHPLPSPTI